MNERYLEALSKLKKEVEDLKVQVNTQKELVNTYRNDKLIDKYEIKDDKWYYNGLDTGKFSRGEAGKSFTYEDFTPEQLEALRGPKGDSFTFDDLTPEEIVLLTGADGLDGEPGRDGYTPIKGVDYFDGKDGKDGRDGLDGKDGETPELEIGEIKSVSTYDPAKVSLKKKKNKYIIDMDIPRGRPGSNGADGSNGIPARINGVTTLTMLAGNNISLDQQGETLTVNSLVNPFTLIVVDELPIENISSSAIYFTPSDDPSATDVFDEWVYINKGTEQQPQFDWEYLGSTAVDLTGYVKNTDYATQNTAGVAKMWTSYNEDNEIGLNISTE